MPKKAVLEGGKRDEIIYAAMELFFKNGFEATSVRMILEKVGGEVGMFYHYFKSKSELFQTVVEWFFKDYRNSFIQLTENCDSIESFVQSFFAHYQVSMNKFGSLSPNLHWTIQYAMVGRTIDELKPAIAMLIEKWGTERKEPLDLIAGQVVYGISATIHSESFMRMPIAEKKQAVIDLLGRLI